MGGKSGTGRIQKHFYYGHPQIKNPLATELKPKCQVKNVRAPRLEELVIKCLKSAISDSSIIAKWAAIYREQTLSNQPVVLAEAKRLDAEILSISKKTCNLVGRIADLPPEVSAELFYEQIKSMTVKKDRLTLAKEKIKTQVQDLGGKDIDEKALTERIRSVVSRIEQVPKEAQRPILKELIHNIEIYPTKLRIGLYSPIKLQYGTSGGPEMQKATGTDGLAAKSNFKKSESSVIPFDPTRRGGSSTVGLGAPSQT